MILLDILEEHLEEADFLLQQRENALSNRVYNLDDLAEIVERLVAHLAAAVNAPGRQRNDLSSLNKPQTNSR
ncbi:MAG: hypothetical protein HY203_09065 [Nitrospirae bacterium]|nr:hypothetical protein [Nitrospirota bacterium]